MDLSYLREFITFSEYMNVSEAARRIHMAQPTLSHHIASVEKEVGVPQLFAIEASTTWREGPFCHFRMLNCGNCANPIAVSEKFKFVLAFPQSNGIVRIDKRRTLL